MGEDQIRWRVQGQAGLPGNTAASGSPPRTKELLPSHKTREGGRCLYLPLADLRQLRWCSGAGLSQAVTDQLISSPFSFCLHMQIHPFQHWSFPMSLIHPTALGPTSSRLQLLAAIFQNVVRLKGQHSISLREKLNSRGEGFRVSMRMRSLDANEGREQLCLQ